MRRSATPGPSSSPREYQTHEQTIDPTGNRPSYETVTETYRREKVQAGSEPPKVPGPIRVIGSGERFSIAKVLRETYVTIPLAQLLDRSEATRKEFAWFLQDATPRFRVRRVKIRDPVSFVSDKVYEGRDRTNQLMICAPAVTSEALEDDGRSSPMFVEAWIGDKKILRTLLDGGSLVELISERMASQISACTYVDNGKEISLADNHTTVLKRYMHLPVNVSGVRAFVKSYIINANTYDLLLGVRWMRRVRHAVDYGEGQVTIQGSNGIPVTLETAMAPIECLDELPVICIDEEGVDDILQRVIDDTEPGGFLNDPDDHPRSDGAVVRTIRGDFPVQQWAGESELQENQQPVIYHCYNGEEKPPKNIKRVHWTEHLEFIPADDGDEDVECII